MPFAVDTVKGRHVDPDSKIIDINVSSTDGAIDFKINGVRSVPKLPINVTSLASNNMLKNYPHLCDVTLSTECADVDLLIGSNAPDCFIIHDQRFGKQPGEPYAQRFPFGWAIIGPVINSRSTAITSQNTSIVQLTTEVTNDQLSEQLSQFWRHDFPDSVSSDKTSLSVDDKVAEKIVNDSIRRSMVDTCSACPSVHHRTPYRTTDLWLSRV